MVNLIHGLTTGSPAPRPRGERIVRDLRLTDRFRRIAVLGDPHGALAGVEAILAREAGDDLLVACVGDVVGRAPAAACAALAARLEGLAVATVRGNHDSWVDAPGGMKSAAGPADAEGLPARTVAWLAGLPHRVRFLDPVQARPLAVMAHCLHHNDPLRFPQWEEATPGNARTLVEGLGSPRLALVGHSHRPRILRLGETGRAEVLVFDFVAREELEVPIPAAGHLVVDAGSVGCPDSGDFAPGKFSKQRPSGYGTYALVDREAGRVFLRRVRYPVEPAEAKPTRAGSAPRG